MTDALQLTPLSASVFNLLAIASLLCSFVMLGSRWLKHYVVAFALQSWGVALLSAAVAYSSGYHELYGVAVLTALTRGLLLPYLILRIVRGLKVERELHERLAPAASLVVGALLVVFAFVVAHHLGDVLGQAQVQGLALTVMLAMMLIGFLLLAVRTEAVSQILGILVLENGLFLGSQILVPGMPLLLELVILFDLLVLVACAGVLVRYLVAHAGTSSAHHLRRLAG